MKLTVAKLCGRISEEAHVVSNFELPEKISAYVVRRNHSVYQIRR